MSTAIQLIREMRQDDDGDKWGWAMSWAFQLCDMIHFRSDLYVPDELQYRPPMTNEMPEDDDYKIEILSRYAPEDWVKVVRNLNRYLDKLKEAGLDY
jgi:hypothetical protein